MDALDKKEELVNGIAKAERDIEAIASNIRELQSQKKKLEKRAKLAREKLLESMLANGVIKDETENFTITQSNTPPKVDIEDIDSVPEEYIRIKKEVDKKTIKEDWKAGKLVLTSNWLKWTEQQPSLTIRGKTYGIK